MSWFGTLVHGVYGTMRYLVEQMVHGVYGDIEFSGSG